MAFEGDTRTALRLSLTIDRGGVKVVHTMLDGIVYLTIDYILIKLVVIIGFCRQAHHTIAQ